MIWIFYKKKQYKCHSTYRKCNIMYAERILDAILPCDAKTGLKLFKALRLDLNTGKCIFVWFVSSEQDLCADTRRPCPEHICRRIPSWVAHHPDRIWRWQVFVLTVNHDQNMYGNEIFAKNCQSTFLTAFLFFEVKLAMVLF